MSVNTLGIIAPHPPILVPEVGGSDAAATETTARALSVCAGLLERFAPDTVVIMSPHTAGYRDAFGVTVDRRVSGDLARFGAPGVSLTALTDLELAREVLDAAERAEIPAAARRIPGSRTDELDHGVLVPLRFLWGHGFHSILSLSFCWLGYEEHERFGRVVADAARTLGRRVAFVASGDCSHRLKPGAPAGYSPRAHLFDEALADRLSAGEFAALSRFDEDLVEDAGECGLRSFITLGGFLAGRDVTPHVLSYEAPWGVGYLTGVFTDPGVDVPPLPPAPTPRAGRKGGMRGSVESPIVALARDAIERYVTTGQVPEPAPLEDAALPQRAGAFVSLHRDGQLRGCIGTIAPTRPSLAEEVAHNAIEAATGDPRFPPLRPDELADLEVKVDVLNEPEQVATEDDLDPRRYGVIVSCGWRRGLLLPDLEGVDDVADQVGIARRKGGIAPHEPVTLERFTVDRHE